MDFQVGSLSCKFTDKLVSDSKHIAVALVCNTQPFSGIIKDLDKKLDGLITNLASGTLNTKKKRSFFVPVSSDFCAGALILFYDPL